MEKNVDVKVVTLDGSLIHKAGLMTGGRSRNDQRRWNKTEVQNLTKLKDDLQFEIGQLQAKSQTLWKLRLWKMNCLRLNLKLL